MRFKRVVARAFGPFREVPLDLAPGMTVVHGLNEAGKTSWQAALYAGLCGLRRSRGAARAEDREFAERHKPWDDGDWRVDVRVGLDDGRQMEIRQDLADKTRCSVTDADRGTDVTGEILNEGTPDGARWLGLDRDSFQAIAFVAQADVLAIRDDADALQEHIQRAAASTDARETAAGAIVRIDSYLSDHVGTERTNSSKPLRCAMDEVRDAESEAEAAAAEHAEYLRLLARADALEMSTSTAAAALDLVRAKRNESTLRSTFERCRVLASAFPDGAPRPLQNDQALAREASAAITGWKDRPSLPALEGRASETIRAEIDALPAPPQGDLKPHPDVKQAEQSYREASHALAMHARQRPEALQQPETGALDATELRRLASELDVAAPPVDPELQERVEAALRRSGAARARRRRSRVGTGIGLVLVVVGGALLAAANAVQMPLPPEIYAELMSRLEPFGPGPVGAAILGAGLIALLASLAWSRAADLATALDELRSAEGAVGAALYAIQDAGARRQAAADRLTEAGLTPESSQVRGLASAFEAWQQRCAELARWQEHARSLERAVESARDQLLHALQARGAGAGTPLGAVAIAGSAPARSVPVADAVAAAAFQAYCAACDERAEQAQRAATRALLNAELTARLALEAVASAARERVAVAANRLSEVAHRCDVLDGPSEFLVEELGRWLIRRDEQIEEHERRQRDWLALQQLLGEGTLADLEAALASAALDVEACRRSLEERARLEVDDVSGNPLDQGLDPFLDARLDERASDVLEEIDALATIDAAEVETRQARVDELRLQVAAARDRVRGLEDRMASVVEVEEKLQRARERLQQVRDLKDTLEQARAFLVKAQEGVHRDAARFLTEIIRPWLPLVTSGRYIDVRIDPDSLEVKVLDQSADEWRDAHLLSRGTSEQIYLLVRAALAQRLPRTGESCPLLLDDVTVQADAERKVAILDLLHGLSETQQIIVFTQENEVLEWARGRLRPGRDSLVALPPAPRGAAALPPPASSASSAAAESLG